MIHCAIDECGKRRVVVELDVAGERRGAGEDDRGRVGRERARSCKRCRPVDPQPSQWPPDGESRSRDYEDRGRRQVGCDARRYRELGDERKNGEPAWDDERARQTQPRDTLEQQPAAERNRPEEGRIHEPRYEQRAHRDLVDRNDLSLRDELRRHPGHGRVHLDLHVLTGVGEVDVCRLSLLVCGDTTAGNLDHRAVLT